MLPPRQNDVFTEFEKYTRFHRIIGMSSLVYSGGKMIVSRKRFIINLFCTSSFLVANSVTANTSRKSVLYLNNWYYILNTGNYFFVTFAIVSSWVQCSRNLDLLNGCLFGMRAVDSQLISIGGKVPPSNTRWAQIVIYLLILTAYLIRVIILKTVLGAIYLLIVYIPFFLVVSVQDNIDKTGSLLLLRFLAINKRLVRCFGKETKKAAPVLEKLILCHHDLCNSSADLDAYHFLQVISSLSSIFYSSFSETFAVISILFKNEQDTNRVLTLTLKSIWLIIIFTLIIRVCHLFQAITTKAKEFNTLLYQIMIEDKTNEILNNPKLKLHIAMNREVVFTAYGFFNLDYSLVHSIIASSTTYLVILLQFSQGPYPDTKGVSSAIIGNITTTPLPYHLTTV